MCTTCSQDTLTFMIIVEPNRIIGSVKPMIGQSLKRHSNFVSLVLAALMMSACGTNNLQRWHELTLESEFTASMEGNQIRQFSDYLELENRLFTELTSELTANVDSDRLLNRFSLGSLSDPKRRFPNWNRTQEFAVESAKGGVLLLHGLTDSPYTMRKLSIRLSNEGFHTIALRLPAHGTAPSALKSLRWEDASAAARVALRHLDEVVGDQPLHVIGYSFGGPLAINLALDAYENEQLTVPKSLVLISPAIGVAKAAALAGAADSFFQIPGLRGRRWSRIVPEFDPYKYNSFTFNAGSQVHQLAQYVSSRLDKRRGKLSSEEAVLPPVLVYQSTLDTTVTAQSIVDRLLDRLRIDRHELVLFDLNRSAAISDLLVNDPGPFTARLMADNDLPFTLSLVTNRNESTTEVEVQRKQSGSASINVIPIDYRWPDSTFSLSHIALPFPPDDPLYGTERPAGSNELFLGDPNFIGETGQLVFPASWLMRIRHNPFYEFLEQGTVNWISNAQM